MTESFHPSYLSVVFVDLYPEVRYTIRTVVGWLIGCARLPQDGFKDAQAATTCRVVDQLIDERINIKDTPMNTVRALSEKASLKTDDFASMIVSDRSITQTTLP